MEGLTLKTFTTSRALTYTYYDSEPTTAAPTTTPPTSDDASDTISDGASAKPPILFLHGFPDSAYLWHRVLPVLRPLSHRFIVPDLLGYGGTDKPADPAAYTSDLMTADMSELLANEGISQAIIVGHDWGAYLAQRMWLWRGPALVVGIVLVSVAYVPPDRDAPFSLDYLNVALEEATGYARYAYWEFFSEVDAAELAADRLESFWCALHGDRSHNLRRIMCESGVLREFLETDERLELKEYAKEGNGWKEEWMARIKAGGFVGPFNWYKAMVLNLNWRKERRIRGDRITIRAPTLFIACSHDDICLPAYIEPPRQAGLLPQLEIRQINSTHWCMMERSPEVAQALYSWLKERWL